MHEHTPNLNLYTTGGSVNPQEQIYATRRADDELLDISVKGEFAYLLTSRQIGKSSLVIRTAQKLRDIGIQSAHIDLQGITEDGLSAEGFYLGLIHAIEDELNISTDYEDWWQRNAHLGLVQRLTTYFRSMLLPKHGGKIVIFLDEVENTLRFPYKNDFFAAIRFLYNERASHPALNKLSFVIIGSAQPGDLISDPKLTPFNIGRRLELTDFTLEEASTLTGGMGVPSNEALNILRWIFKWTNGHPYLTQRLIVAVIQSGHLVRTEADVDAIVCKTFLGTGNTQDDNLAHTGRMLTIEGFAPNFPSELRLYDKIRRRGRIPDDHPSQEKNHLKLTGIVRKQDGALRVSNRIYESVFNDQWVRKHNPADWSRRAWFAAGWLSAGIFIAALAAVPLLLAQNSELDRTNQNLKALANTERQLRKQLEVALGQAESGKQEAEQQKSVAEQQRAIAEEQSREKERQRQVAEESAREAGKQRRLAQVQRRAALAARDEAESSRANAVQQAERALVSEQQAQEARDDAQQQRDRAEQERQKAERLSKIALGSNLGALAEVTRNQQPRLLQQSVLLARESVGQSLQSPPTLGYQVLSHGLSLLPRSIPGPEAGTNIDSITLSDNGKYLIVIYDDPKQDDEKRFYTVRVFNTSNNQEIPIPQHNYPFGKTYFNFYTRKYAATISGDRTLLITELSNGHTTPAFKVDGYEYISQISVSADGKSVAIRSGSTIQVRNLAGVSQGPALERPTKEGWGPTFLSPDGKLIFRLGLLSPMSPESPVFALGIWEVASGKQVINAATGSGGPPIPFFSSDGKYVTVVDGNTVRLYVTSNIKQPLWSKNLSGDLSIAVFSSDGERLAMVTGTNVVRLLSTASGAEIASQQVDESVNSLILSDNGKLFGTGHSKMVRVWRWNSRWADEIARVILDGELSDFEFNPDGKSLLTVEQDASLRVWDLTGEKGFVRRKLAETVRIAKFSPDKKRLFALEDASDGVVLRAWDTNGGREGTHKIKLAKVRTSQSRLGTDMAAPSFNGRYLADIEVIGEMDARTKVKVWDMSDGSTKEILLKGEMREPVAVSSDGKYFAVTQASDNALNVIVFDISNTKELACIDAKGHADLNTIAFSPDARHLVMGYNDYRALVWDIKENQQAAYFAHHQAVVPALGSSKVVNSPLAFSESGKYLVSAGVDAQLWTVGDISPVLLPRTAKVAPTVATVENEPVTSSIIHSVAFSADERYVAAGSSDNNARVWETATGNLVAILRHDGAVFNLALSKNGEYLATISEGNSGRVWRLGEGVEVARIPLRSTKANENYIAFSPDGKYLLSTRSGAAVEIWLWHPEDLLSLSCKLLTVSEPSRAMWHEYLGNELATYLLANPHDHCPPPR